MRRLGRAALCLLVGLELRVGLGGAATHPIGMMRDGQSARRMGELGAGVGARTREAGAFPELGDQRTTSTDVAITQAASAHAIRGADPPMSTTSYDRRPGWLTLAAIFMFAVCFVRI